MLKEKQAALVWPIFELNMFISLWWNKKRWKYFFSRDALLWKNPTLEPFYLPMIYPIGGGVRWGESDMGKLGPLQTGIFNSHRWERTARGREEHNKVNDQNLNWTREL